MILTRYKMPKMTTKQESRLNGAKVNITNLETVGKALRVNGDILLKFMCAELGTSKEGNSTIKGDHKYESLLKILDK
jgi:hypothetical protein